MNKKQDLKKLVGMEFKSLVSPVVKPMYDIIYTPNEDEGVKSPYELDKDKSIYTTRHDVVLPGTVDNKMGVKYTFKEYSSYMTLAKELFLHDTFPSIAVKDEFQNTTRIKHCKYPGHTRIESANLVHGVDHTQTIDNVSLDIYVQTNIPNYRREFYEKMVGGSKENTTWNTSLPSFTVSVPQPWYFSVIQGAELRLGSDTTTELYYVYRREPTCSLLMQIREDADSPWEDVSVDNHLDRLIIGTVSTKTSPILELNARLYKCPHDYAKSLKDATIVVPSEDIIILDRPESDGQMESINIDSFDFVKRITILTENWNIQNKCIYLDGLQDGSLLYTGGVAKITSFDKLTVQYDNVWASTPHVPDMDNINTITFSNHNAFGDYDTSVNLGGLDSILRIHLKKDMQYKVRVRLHTFKIINYVDGKIYVNTDVTSDDIEEQ